MVLIRQAIPTAGGPYFGDTNLSGEAATVPGALCTFAEVGGILTVTPIGKPAGFETTIDLAAEQSDVERSVTVYVRVDGSLTRTPTATYAALVAIPPRVRTPLDDPGNPEGEPPPNFVGGGYEPLDPSAVVVTVWPA